MAAARIPGPARPALLLLLLLLLSPVGGCRDRLPPGRDLRCVYGRGADGQAMGAFLAAWADRHHLGPLAGWDASLEHQTARIRLSTPAFQGHATLGLGATCGAGPTRLTSTPITGAPLPAAALADLAAGLPAPRHAVTDRRVDGTRYRTEGRAFWLAGLGLLALVLLLAHGLPRRPRVAVLAMVLGGAALAVWAALPLLAVPFTNDAQVLRAAFAREHLLGDWNHPFLPYLLNAPVARFTLDPVALRLIPLCWLVAEVVLLGVAAARAAGPAAGVLAVAWFAAEVRRRHGIEELSDWDLAGAFLLAALLWLQRAEERTEPPGPRALLGLGLLLTGAVLSSYMAIVPAVVLVGTLWLVPAWHGRVRAWPTAVVAVLALVAGRVFLLGSTAPRRIASLDLLGEQVLRELPSGRTLGMILPLGLGLAWLVARHARPTARLVLGFAFAQAVALVVAWRFSVVKGGYYLSLLTPVLVLAAAAGTAWTARALADRLGPRIGPRAAAGLGAGIAAGVLAMTLSLPSLGLHTSLDPGGHQHLVTFARRVRADDLPIVTSWAHLPRFVAFARARAGEIRSILRPRPGENLAHRIRVVDRRCTLDRPEALRHGFHVVALRGAPDLPACLGLAARGCRRLFPRADTLNYWTCAPVSTR